MNYGKRVVLRSETFENKDTSQPQNDQVGKKNGEKIYLQTKKGKEKENCCINMFQKRQSESSINYSSTFHLLYLCLFIFINLFVLK